MVDIQVGRCSRIKGLVATDALNRYHFHKPSLLSLALQLLRLFHFLCFVRDEWPGPHRRCIAGKLGL